MDLIRESKESDTARLSAMEKRILITKAVALTYELLAKRGAFKRAFIATGTQTPIDHSADKEVSLQGLEFDYKIVCSQAEINKQKNKIKVEQAAEEAKRLEAAQIIEENKRKLELKFVTVEESSKILWQNLKPLITDVCLVELL